MFEEGAAGDTQFHGGFGLINFVGLKKASYYGYWFLARLAEEKLALGDDFIITRKGEDVQILLWNYCHYTQAFASGDRAALKPHDRYGVFNLKARAASVSTCAAWKALTRCWSTCSTASMCGCWMSGLKMALWKTPTPKTWRSETAYRAGGEDWKSGRWCINSGEVTLAPHGVLLIELKKTV